MLLPQGDHGRETFGPFVLDKPVDSTVSPLRPATAACDAPFNLRRAGRPPRPAKK